MTPELTILYEDNHCLAVSKPAPLLTQGPLGVPTLEAMVKAYIKDRYKKPGNVYLGIPHRLDRPVSGVVVFARNTKAAQRLAEQFQQRQVRKVYWAVVEPNAENASPPETGVWEDWLLKIQDEARTECVGPETPRSRRAALRFRRLAASADGALLEIEPETGRMHQIRVQAATRGWPVRGDFLYGARLPFGPPPHPTLSPPGGEGGVRGRDRIIALHARSLTFLHPIRYEPLTVTAPAPEAWRAWAAQLPPPATPISP
ncbi:MAG TPA: RluA family pseudouridine synthase [Gemmataceae bacterium]|nr:RluA family pseudouridine synthase [Gemmataceae bacterium]